MTIAEAMGTGVLALGFRPRRRFGSECSREMTIEGDRLRFGVRCDEDCDVCDVTFVDDDEVFVMDDRVEVDELLDMDEERTRKSDERRLSPRPRDRREIL